MHPNNNNMDYSKYSASELRRFVKDRKLDLALRPMAGRYWATSEDCIEALEEADRDYRFRFMDLTPELRNIMYELLLNNGGLSTAHPNILQACKQIYNEASGILFVENQFTIKIAHGDIPIGRVHKMYWSEPYILNFATIEWARYIAKAKRLKIECEGPGTCRLSRDLLPLSRMPAPRGWPGPPSYELGARAAAFLNHAMYSLCCFLDDHQNSPAIELDILWIPGPITCGRAYQECLASAFRPLRILDSLKLDHVKFTNLDRLDGSMVKSIQALWDEPSWVRLDTTPFQVWINAMKRAKAVNKLVEQLYELESPRTPFLPLTKVSFEKLLSLLRKHKAFRMTYKRPHERFITAENEWDILEPLRELDVELDELDLEEVKHIVIAQVADKDIRDVEAMEETTSEVGSLK